MIGRYARPKAARVKSLKDYRKISYVSNCNEWIKLENDNAFYKASSLVVLSSELEKKLLDHRQEISEIMKKKP